MPDKEEPRVDDAAGETRHGGGDQPVQAAAGLHQEGEPGHADEHGSDRVRGEPLDVAGHLLIATVTSSPVQDENDDRVKWWYSRVPSTASF